MITTQIPLRTMREVWEMLPEGTRVQLINNKLVMSPAPSYGHFSIQKKIFLKLNLFVVENNLGEVFFAPIDVYLDEENYYEPDIFFISAERKNIVKENGIHGAPDLVIEVLSASNKKDDEVEKKDIYMKAGVKEYWIVDPETKRATGYFLRNTGSYERIGKEVGKLAIETFWPALTITF